MEVESSIVSAIIRKNNAYSQVYLNELTEQSDLEPKNADELIQYISSALSKSCMHNEALVVLISYLGEISLNVLERKASFWTTLTLKAINSKATDLDYELAYTALSLLALKSSRSCEVSKSFSSNHLSKVYESLVKVPPTGHLAALQCVEICLRLYPGPSGPFRNSVDKFVSAFLDTLDENLCLWSGKCIHLLQQVRGGGIQGLSHKSSWSRYQEKLLESLHSVLDLVFSNCTELYEKPKLAKGVGFPIVDLDNEPTKRAAQLYIRVRNLVNYLISALRDPFPVAKPIMPKKILNVISRGLNVTCFTLEKNPITDNLAFCVLLPKMHFFLLDLLQTLIITLKTNLKPHHLTVLDMLVDTLNWTYSRQTAGKKKTLSTLRSKVYEVLSLWCMSMQNGSRIELFGEAIMEQVLFDITPFQNECTLKVLSGSKKHMSKKARRQLHKAQNARSHITQSHAHDSSLKNESLSEERNQKICASALKCLQQILLSATNFLKPTLIKMIHNKVTQICALFYELPLEPQQLYFNWECRLEIYKVLLLFITQTHHLCPPPTQIVIHILSAAQVFDRHPTVRKQCAESLTYLENIIHPRKEGLLFPVEIRNIRNYFTLAGKENLVEEGVFDAEFQNGIDDSNELTETSCENLTNAVVTQESADTSRKNDSATDSIEIMKNGSLDIDVENCNDVQACDTPILSINETHIEKSEEKLAEHHDSLLRPPLCKKKKLDLNEEHALADSSNAEADRITVDLADDCSNKVTENDSSCIMLVDETNGCVEHKSDVEMATSRTDDDILAEIEAAFVDELN